MGGIGGPPQGQSAALSEGEQRTADLFFLEPPCDPIEGVTLGDPAEIDGHSFGQGQAVSVEFDLAETDFLSAPGDGFRAW